PRSARATSVPSRGPEEETVARLHPAGGGRAVGSLHRLSRRSAPKACQAVRFRGGEPMGGPRRSSQHRAIACALLLVTGCASLKKWAYEGSGRDESQQPDRVVAALGITHGDRVADLGSGGGYFTFRLADAVGPNGKVYAIDIDPDMTELVARMAPDRGARNLEALPAEPGRPHLPHGAVSPR